MRPPVFDVSAWWPWPGAAMVALVAIVVAFRLARPWLEEHEWVARRGEERRPTGTVVANALAQIDALYNPAAEHVIEYRRSEQADSQATGEDLDPLHRITIDPPSEAGPADER